MNQHPCADKKVTAPAIIEHNVLGKVKLLFLHEAIIARVTLSLFTYNLLSYINRIHHEPKTLGELFRDLECELEALAISMQLFLQFLTQLAEFKDILKRNKDLFKIIAVLSAYTKKELGNTA